MARLFNRLNKAEWFTEGGISPTGECWVSPTDIFLRFWEGPAGKHLKKQGFRLRHNGKHLGASQDCILLLPNSEDQT